MTPAELRAHCERQMELVGPDAQVLLTFPGPFPRSGRKRLAGRYGPVGEAVCENSEGRVAVYFRASEVLEYLDRAEATDAR